METIDYEEILKGGEVFVPKEVREGNTSFFCAYVPMRGPGWVYKITTGKDGKLSRGSLGQNVFGVYGPDPGSADDSWSLRNSAFRSAYGPWKNWQSWKKSLPIKQPQLVAPQRERPSSPYRRPYHDSDDDNNNTT